MWPQTKGSAARVESRGWPCALVAFLLLPLLWACCQDLWHQALQT